MVKDMNDLLVALRHWSEEDAELRRCYDKAEVSAGYHCYEFAERERRAREVFGDILAEVIDQRVAAKLAEAK